MNRIPLRAIVLFAAALAAVQQTASAHAFLDHADPRVGAKVGTAPADVRIWFTQAVEPAFSRIQVFDSAGKQVDKDNTHVAPKDRQELIVSLPQLPPGTYRVKWHVISVDTHPTQGDFRFVVKP